MKKGVFRGALLFAMAVAAVICVIAAEGLLHTPLAHFDASPNPLPLNSYSLTTPPGYPPTGRAPSPLLYIEVAESCGPAYEGECVVARTGPGLTYPVVARLRTGIVLATSRLVQGADHSWYEIALDASLRYPERAAREMYVAADMVVPFYHEGPVHIAKHRVTPSAKRILVDRSEQVLRAYEGDTVFMEEAVSTGIASTPTPRGVFHIYQKTPSRYMQGPIPGISTKPYDLIGVPWDLYFTQQGAVIHGAYWHDHFGEPWSNGCVNLPPEAARKLYEWADLGTQVIVQD